MHDSSKLKFTLIASGVLTFVSACGDTAPNGSQGTAGSGMISAGSAGIAVGGAAGAASGQGQA